MSQILRETMKINLLLGSAALLLAGCEIQQTETPVTFLAARGRFHHEITSRGTVCSEGGAEVRCDVDAAGPEGTMILEIVPEGTSVDPGDLLVQLDTSLIEDQRLQQRIYCNEVEAELAAATNEHEKATFALEEYVEGLYPEQSKAAENDRLDTEDRLQRARLRLQAAEDDSKSEEGSAEDLGALRFNVEMAVRDVERAKARIATLEEYTKPLQLKQLEGDVKSSEAIMRAKQEERNIHAKRLAEIERQIAACTIKAPSAGVVFYANVPGETEEDDIIISEGTPMRRRQVILYIAQLEHLGVRTEVAESDIAHIRVDMPADIYVDAMPGEPFNGRVARIHPYPTRETRGGSGKKKYEVHVSISNPSGTLRPGLTAEVELSVAELDDVIQVPTTSIFEESGAKYCLIHDRDQWLARRVVTGPSNGTMTVVLEGLAAEDNVAIHPSQYRRQATP